MAAALVERSAVVVKRRKVLGGLFAAGAGIFGIVALFPLMRSPRAAARRVPRRHHVAPGHPARRLERAAGPARARSWWAGS